MMLVRLWLLLVLSCNLTLQTNANMEGCLFGDSPFFADNNIGKNFSCKNGAQLAIIYLT